MGGRNYEGHDAWPWVSAGASSFLQCVTVHSRTYLCALQTICGLTRMLVRVLGSQGEMACVSRILESI